MITKKLAVPLVNDKILQQAEHCYIASSSISEEGFEFLRSRISPKCKMDIVTGLDVPTSPAVLWKILRHYQGRINLHIYTKNTMHANLFVFDLPFRKSVAFVGSGSMSAEGLKDSEELFWKLTDAKEIESLMSWYTTYFQFGTPLTESIVRGYETLYPRLKAREIRSAQEKRNLIEENQGNLDSVKFRNQFFQRDDFSVLGIANALSDNASLRMARIALAEKLMKLHSMLEAQLSGMKFELGGEKDRSPDPQEHRGEIVDSMWLVYGYPGSKAARLRIGITAGHIVVAAVVGSDRDSANHRRNFLLRFDDPSVKQRFYQDVTSLNGYLIEAAGKLRIADSFRSEHELFAFIDSEDARTVEVVFARRILPGDSGLSNDAIAATLTTEMNRLLKLIP